MMPENMMLPMVVLAALYMIVSTPEPEMVAGVVNGLLLILELVDEVGHPTMLGQVLHVIVFNSV